MEPAASNDRLRWLLTIVVLGLAAFAVFMWWRAARTADPAVLLPQSEEREAVVTVTSRPTMIGVDIVGAVRKPGLYYLPPEARVDDAVKAAGGFAPDANRDALNLAARVKDEQQLRVPRVGETLRQPVAVAASVTATPGKLDLNTADAKALETLPGIGPATAQQIVDYRAAQGPFRSIDQLDDVPGIGATTINTLRDLVTVTP